jgi:hypothetical protein
MTQPAHVHHDDGTVEGCPGRLWSPGPADELEAAATLLRKRATEATPGPWERPLDTRDKAIVGAALPEDEEPHSWRDGTIPEYFGQYPGYANRYAGQRERVAVAAASTRSNGRHARKRSGRDLEYIALMDPDVGLTLADLMDAFARAIRMADEHGVAYPEPVRPLELARLLLRDKHGASGGGARCVR